MTTNLNPARRSLLDAASALVRATSDLANGNWDPGQVQLSREAYARLADHAGNLGMDAVRMAALDLYINLAASETETRPDLEHRSEIKRLAQELENQLRPIRADTLGDAPEFPSTTDAADAGQTVVIWDTTKVPDGLNDSWQSRGVSLVAIADAEALATQLGSQLPVAILAFSNQIPALIALLDELARRIPASANIIVVGIGPGGDDDRFYALLGGCELYAERLDEPTLVDRVLEQAKPPSPPYRVLLIDDDASTRMYAKAVLQQAGFAVEALADAENVEHTIAQFAPDLLLVDLFMPVIDGMTLTRRLRAQQDLAMLPIVFLSGEQGDQARLQAIHAGGDDFLTKPIRPRTLVTTLRDRINRVRSLRRQLVPVVSAVAERRGRSRRGEFLARVAESRAPDIGAWRVLMAIKIDQADTLHDQLGLAGSYALEQSIDLRLIDVLDAEDHFALWQEFGFGLLVERPSKASLQQLASELCRAIAERPFKVLGEDMLLTASVGFALAPNNPAQEGADQWIAAAFAAQSMAHRLGGNRYDGVLELGAGNLSSERILFIREAVKATSKVLNIQVEFQPMLRIHGNQEDQYRVIAKLRDPRAPLTGISRDEYLEIARAAGVMPQIDRIAVFRALEAIDEQRSHGRTTRLSVPLDLLSFDRVQYLWLVNELRRRNLASPPLDIEFDAQLLLKQPKFLPILERLLSFKLGIVLDDRSGSLVQISEYMKMPATQLRIPFAAVSKLDPEAFIVALSGWRALGRAIVVDAVDEVAAVMRLWSFGIDYLEGDALAAPSPRLDFAHSEIGT